MKTYKGFYERIASFENLHSAFRKAAKGKGLRADCAGFSYGREREILLLQEELQSGAYRHGPYRAFAVRDPKVREVKAARFRDRVVHHALCNVIEPIFEARFLPESFACRKGRGTLAALKACRREVRRFTDGYVLKADVSKLSQLCATMRSTPTEMKMPAKSAIRWTAFQPASRRFAFTRS